LNSLPKYLKINFLVSTGKTLTISLVTLLLLPIIITRLGLELYGVISLTLLFSSISSIIDLGLSKSIVLLSGENKLSENKIVSSAIVINIIIIAILTIIFICLQLCSIELLGKDINIQNNYKFALLNTGFLMLILMLLNNLCRAILEANYLMHIVSLSLTFYTPLLYVTVFLLSFFTQNILFYIITPLILTSLTFLFNLCIIKMKTKVKIVPIKRANLIYVIKHTIGFLNIGLVNSMVMPIMRYAFILMTADVGLYALFDLSFKIAMLANGFIISIATPMFAVFSKKIKTNTEEMVRISYKIFALSIVLYLCILLGFYIIGDYLIPFLNLNIQNTTLLYSITFILILSLGSVAVVEVFYRYFLGNKQLTQAFLLKLTVPIGALLFFCFFYEYDLIYRFIYAYSISLFISAILIFFTFVNQSKKLLKI